MRKMALRRETQLEADICYRNVRTSEPIERPLDPHGVGIERRRYSGILSEELEEMRPGQTRVTRHIVEFDAFRDAIVQNAQRFANAKIDRALRPGRYDRAAADFPGLLETRIKELIQITIDDSIAGVGH